MRITKDSQEPRRQPIPSSERTVTDEEYARLLAFRARLRAFEHWSAQRASELGLTASQHQLLLAIRGHGTPLGPTIGQAAEYLLIQHNTAVELADRVQHLGLLARVRDDEDHRVVRLQLTDEGSRRLEALSAAHLDELAGLSPLVDALRKDLRNG